MYEKCYFCKGKVVQKKITLDFRWGEDLVVIKDVPAGVCQQCGEKYIESSVYKELESMAKSKGQVTDTIKVDVLEFESSLAA
jgi:YgiT-type zinc finger domain-containing protein